MMKMKQNGKDSETVALLRDVLLPLWKTSLFTPTEEDLCSMNYSIIQNIYLISNLFDTAAKLKWLQEHRDIFREIVKETFFNKDCFINENYEALEQKLKEYLKEGDIV